MNIAVIANLLASARRVPVALMRAWVWGLLLLATAAKADGRLNEYEVLRAVNAGLIRPLHDIEQRVRAAHPGQILEVELERKEGVWVYEFKLLQPDGSLLKLYADAASGEVLRSKTERKPLRENAQ